MREVSAFVVILIIIVLEAASGANNGVDPVYLLDDVRDYSDGIFTAHRGAEGQNAGHEVVLLLAVVVVTGVGALRVVQRAHHSAATVPLARKN